MQVPLPSDDAFNSYFNSAVPTDPCSIVAAAPSSLKSEIASFTSAVVAAITAQSSALSKVQECFSELSGLPISAEIDQVLRLSSRAAGPGASQPTQSTGSTVLTSGGDLLPPRPRHHPRRAVRAARVPLEQRRPPAPTPAGLPETGAVVMESPPPLLLAPLACCNSLDSRDGAGGHIGKTAPSSISAHPYE